jgi:protein arginine kinase activator
MKCKFCEKPATFHITDLTGSELQELHLCEDHARQYLAPAQGDPNSPGSSAAGGVFAQHDLSQTADELDRLDQQSCPVCGITFFEFRNEGRLGCPHDYVRFDAELEPLILNIHGNTKHIGKRPRRAAGDSDWQTDLIRLRRELKEAVEQEDYERASELRDEIRGIQQMAERGDRP